MSKCEANMRPEKWTLNIHKQHFFHTLADIQIAVSHIIFPLNEKVSMTGITLSCVTQSEILWISKNKKESNLFLES